MKPESTKQFTYNGTTYYVNEIPGTQYLEISNETRATVFLVEREQFDGPATPEVIWNSIVHNANRVLTTLFSAKERTLTEEILADIARNGLGHKPMPLNTESLITRALKFYKEHI